VHTKWTITALTATIAAALTLTACSSSHSPSPTPSSKSGAGGGGGLKTISNCLSSHGADPSSLGGLISGSPVRATSAQLVALRAASKACESSVPPRIKRGLTSTVSCLDRRGYHLDASAPLSALFSLDVSKSAVASALTGCSAALSSRASSSAGS
jgi:hypothetical protein